MASELHKIRVGIFVCIGFGLLVASLLVWSHMSFSGRPRIYECYFNESVQGLTLDSPVRFRGINVGSVDYIGIAPDGQLAEVHFAVDAKSDFKVDIEEMCIRIVGNILTGIKYLEIELVTDGEKPSRSFDFETEYPVVGTRRSMSPEDIFYQITKFLDDMNIKDISCSITNILDVVKSRLNDKEVEVLLANIRSSADNIGVISANLRAVMTKEAIGDFTSNLILTTSNLRKVSESLDKRLDDATLSNIVANITVTGENLREISSGVSREDVERLKASVQNFTDQANALMNAALEDLDDLSQEVQRSAINIRAFTDSLRARPAQTLFGEKSKNEE